MTDGLDERPRDAMTPPRLARWLLDALRRRPTALMRCHRRPRRALRARRLAAAPLRARRRIGARPSRPLWHLLGRTTPRVALTPRRRSRDADALAGTIAHGAAAVRQRSRRYAWAAVVTLALAIGANTVIFSIANVLVLKPLPIRRRSRSGWILATGPNAAPDRAGVSLPEFAAYRDEVRAFTQLAAWRRAPVTMRVGDEAERVLGQRVVGDLQGTLGPARRTRTDACSGATKAPARRARRRAQPPLLDRRASVARRTSSAARCSSTASRTPSSACSTPAIELGNLAGHRPLDAGDGRPGARGPADRGVAARGPARAGGARSTTRTRRSRPSRRALANERPTTNRDWTARVGTHPRRAGRREHVGRAVAPLHGRRPAAGAGLRQHHESAHRPADRPAAGTGGAHGARRHARPDRAPDRRREPAHRAGRRASSVWPSPRPACGPCTQWPPSRSFARSSSTCASSRFAFVLAFVAPLAFAVLPTLRVLARRRARALGEGSLGSIGGGRPPAAVPAWSSCRCRSR